MGRLVMFLFLFITVTYVQCVYLPDAYLSTPGIIKHWGYPVETHEALTNDGYYLTLHRIPHGKRNSTTGNASDAEEAKKGSKERPVFLLMHSLLASSASFVFNLPQQSLGFVLADAGYDVWMGNMRGNVYSKKHKTLDVKSRAFWDFSFQHMAKYDLPALIDHVLHETNQTALYYVGHSQGNVVAFAGLSENIALQSKIKMFISLGPVTRLRNVARQFKLLAYLEGPLSFALRLIGVYEVLPASKSIKTADRLVCRLVPKFCAFAVQILLGYDTTYINSTRMQVYLTHIPAGTSLRNMDHFFQLIKSGMFAKYDYGYWGNLQHYNTSVPPEYKIANIRTPAVIISGANDWVSTPEDIKWTVQQLPDVRVKIEVPGYNHIDFVSAKNAAEQVHNKIVKIARNFEGGK